METIINEIRATLQHNMDEKALASSQYFFKEKIQCYGVRAATVHLISKESFQLVKSKTKAEIFDLCGQLWQSGYIEESMIACHWSYHLRKKYTPEDFQLFESWIDNYVHNWATCDTFCNHTMGTFIEMYPEFMRRLKDFARSDNRWKRRAAAVSLIVPARKGRLLKDIFEIADILLLDKDDMVQKGYGWMLKEASKAHPDVIFEYVMKHKAVMPRTAYRYAIEKLPADLRRVAMER